MNAWAWIHDAIPTSRALLRLLLKTALWFIALNLLFALLDPLPTLGHLTLYNSLFPGRERLPYGADSADYNLTLDNLPAMFASHRLSKPKAADEFRVVLIGDSSIWGTLLENRETLAGQLDAMGLEHNGQPMRFTNAGYPTMSVTKDLLMLAEAMRFDPDLILWPVTLESLPTEAQLDAPILQRNPDASRALIATYNLTSARADDPRFVELSWFDRTIVGSRRPLADVLRLQVFGFAWAGTGIDQLNGPFTPRANDLEADESWHGHNPDTPLAPHDLAFDVLAAGFALAAETPVLLVNEPIFRADGANSDVRYNAWYPRWAYDEYRALLAEETAANGWPLLDLWDAVPPAEFTDSPVHLTPAGVEIMAEAVAEWLGETAD